MTPNKDRFLFLNWPKDYYHANNDQDYPNLMFVSQLGKN